FVVPAIDFQLARIEIERGRVTEGLAMLRDIKPQMSGLLRPKLGAVLGWEAEALLRLGRPNEAIPLARESVAELTQYRDLDSLWYAQWREGKALAGAGDRPAALAAFNAAVTTVTALRRFPMGYRLESTFFADKLPLFDDAIFLAADLGDAPTAARLIEQVKSRALTSMLTVASVAGQKSGDLDAAVDDLSRRVDVLEYAAYQSGWTGETVAVRDRLLTERTRLLERILVSDPRWRTLSRPAEPDLNEIAASLERANQAALSLYYRSGRVVTLLIYRGRAQIAVKSLSESTVAAISAYQENLSSATSDHGKLDPSAWPDLAADRLVPVELLSQALGADGLVVVPHGPLHLLPWSALTLDGTRLFERCAVGVLPNMSCLKILEPAPAGPPSIALLGAPTYLGTSGLSELPLAAEELFTVAEIFGDRVVGAPRIGAEATQDAYRELLADPKGTHGILHLACHGDLVAGDPENSGLLLHDGKLDASEIARRKIPFDEVVLSACASGYRPTRVGSVELSADDIVGLPGAFLEAGARSVLVSIPPARDDAALAFMTLYYEHRVLGEPPLRSFREAEMAMLAAGDYPAHLWAGFTFYGR
ncbi:MAG: CHAT domain-containing protein, partial [Gemmatimonadota bacterium]